MYPPAGEPRRRPYIAAAAQCARRGSNAGSGAEFPKGSEMRLFIFQSFFLFQTWLLVGAAVLVVVVEGEVMGGVVRVKWRVV